MPCSERCLGFRRNMTNNLGGWGERGFPIYSGSGCVKEDHGTGELVFSAAVV